MNEFLEEHAAEIWWFTAASVVMLVGSALIVPWIVIRIPSDYFLEDRRPPSRFAFQHPAIRWTIFFTRNLVGAVLFLAGLVMLVLPGQGLLTLATSIVLFDLPGKHRLERWIIRLPPVLKSLNWLRKRANVPPLRVRRAQRS